MGQRFCANPPARKFESELVVVPGGTKPPYFIAEKRLSNEFAGMIGWAPATRLPAGFEAGAGSAGGVSEEAWG